MRLVCAATALALFVSGCTTDNYGPSQGYVYPSPGHGSYAMRPYYEPARYGYHAPYGAGGNGGPSITLTVPAGTVP